MGRQRMTATQAFKKRFVERRLAPMLEDATDGLVRGVAYAADRDAERVDVDIGRPPWRLRVDVGQLCKWDVAWEVMNAVEEAMGA